MRSRALFIIAFILLGVCIGNGTPSAKDKKTAKQSQDDGRVHLVHADRLYYNERENRDAQYLVGNVEFEHQGVLMYCDSALYYEATNSFDAFGNVKMNQGDTLTLTGDELYYKGIDQLAQLSDELGK